MIDQIDPGPKTSIFKNSGPIDLSYLGARVVDRIPVVTALNAPSPHSSARSSTPIYERGIQTNFDSETSCIGLSVLAKDYRRALGADSSPKAVSTYDPAVTLRNRKKKEMQEIVVIDSPLSSLSPASIPETNRGTKRKEPDVVISDDEVIPVKRGRAGKAPAKTAGKTTAAKTTAAKTTGGKATRGGVKKKRGG